MAENDDFFLRQLFEHGPLSSKSLEQAVNVDQVDEAAVNAWAEDAMARGLIEPSEVAPNRWQITDAGRRAIGNDPQR